MKTVILFARHEDHVNQVLPPEAHTRAVARGKKLKELGIKIDAVVSSPLPRAVRTALALLEGHGATPNIQTDPRLGDFKSDPRTPPDSMKKLKGLAVSKYGNDSDANLARAMLDLPELHDFLMLRAQEGAEALIEIAAANVGKTVLVTSHGVARMELVLRYLRNIRGNELLEITDELIDRGEIVEINIEVEGKSASFVQAFRLKLLDEPGVPRARGPTGGIPW